VVDTLEQIGSLLGQTVVVVGQGAIGLGFTMMASHLGALRVIGVDPLDYRLAAARDHGATDSVNPTTQNARAEIRRITNGAGADVVIEACGEVEAIASVVDYVRPSGKVAFFGLTLVPVIPFPYAKMMLKAPTIITATTGPRGTSGGVRDAVSLVANRQVDPAWMITHRLPFDEAARAFELYDQQADGVIKVVLHLS
jgi:threonine dehydrogenase-like Zn-dependent dehydrogenase